MKKLFTIYVTTFLLFKPAFLKAQPQLITGCQGEACDCFREYQSVSRSSEVKTIRPFTVYKDASKSSAVLGEFIEGTKARLIAQHLLVEEPGRYIVKKVKSGQKIQLRRGDVVHTMINDGEGFVTVTKNKKSVSFYSEDVEFRTAIKTKISDWMHIQVNTVEGYTPDQPFEGCLE